MVNTERRLRRKERRIKSPPGADFKNSRILADKILWQDYCGKGNLRKSYCSTAGRKFPFGNAYLCTVKKDYSYLCMWMTSNWLERNKHVNPMWKVLNKEVDLGEPTSFLHWGTLQDKVK